MRLRRRTLLGMLLTLGAGCGSQAADDERRTATPTTEAPETPETLETAETRTGSEQTADSTRGTLVVVNDADEDHFVTVAVDRGDEPVFVESRTVRQRTAVTFDDVVSDGRYGVVVETAAGSRGRVDWDVRDPLDTLRVRLTASITFSLPVVCDPDCRTISLGGASTGYPAGGFDPRGRRAGSELRIHNGGDRVEHVRVRVADGAVLDYEYTVAPRVTLVIPVPQRSGPTSVRVDVRGGRTRGFDWPMETDPVRYVRI